MTKKRKRIKPNDVTVTDGDAQQAVEDWRKFAPPDAMGLLDAVTIIDDEAETEEPKPQTDEKGKQ